MIRTPHWAEAEPITHTVIEEVSEKLRTAGAVIEEPALSGHFDVLTAAHLTIQYFEVAHWRVYEWDNHRDDISEPMQEFIAEGRKTSFADYKQAQIIGAEARAEFDALFDTYDHYCPVN